MPTESAILSTLPTRPQELRDELGRSPSVEGSRPAAPRLLSTRELERLTGVASERLRTWSRRYGFPSTVPGARRYSSEDVPGVIAAKQLIESGIPAETAIARARRWDEAPIDVSLLERTFDAIDLPVCAYRATEPISSVFRNPAAQREGVGSDDAPLQDAFLRQLQKLAASASNVARTIWLPSWTAPELKERQAIAYSLGAPVFTPAIVVVMVLPSCDDTVRRADAERASQSRERQFVAGLARARRAFQAYRGPAAVPNAFGKLVDETGADDGFLAMEHAGGIHCSVSHRGAMHPPRVQPEVGRHIVAATTQAPAWLDPRLAARLGVTEGACLAVPLAASATPLGFACLRFAEPFELGHGVEEILMSFGTQLAAVVARDRV